MKKIHSFFVCLFADAHAHAMISSFYRWTNRSSERLNNQAHARDLKSSEAEAIPAAVCLQHLHFDWLISSNKRHRELFLPLPPLFSLSLSRWRSVLLTHSPPHPHLFPYQSKDWSYTNKSKSLGKEMVNSPVQACLGSRHHSIRVYIPPEWRYQPNLKERPSQVEDARGPETIAEDNGVLFPSSWHWSWQITKAIQMIPRERGTKWLEGLWLLELEIRLSDRRFQKSCHETGLWTGFLYLTQKEASGSFGPQDCQNPEQLVK